MSITHATNVTHQQRILYKYRDDDGSKGEMWVRRYFFFASLTRRVFSMCSSIRGKDSFLWWNLQNIELENRHIVTTLLGTYLSDEMNFGLHLLFTDIIFQ